MYAVGAVGRSGKVEPGQRAGVGHVEEAPSAAYVVILDLSSSSLARLAHSRWFRLMAL